MLLHVALQTNDLQVGISVKPLLPDTLTPSHAFLLDVIYLCPRPAADLAGAIVTLPDTEPSPFVQVAPLPNALVRMLSQAITVLSN